MNKETSLLIALATLMGGIGIGYVLFNQPASTSAGAADESAAATPPAREVLFYRNPMNPAITSPVPAQDEMGMDYIPVYADGSAQSDVAGTVEIDPVVVQNIGVRTTRAERRSLSRTIKTIGRVDFNETRMARLHPKVDGWIEEIWIDETGQQVAADDILLSFYSPKLVSAQQEYLLALNNQAALADSPFEQIRVGAQNLTRSARERLELWDVPAHQIAELEETRQIKKYIHIHAPWAGTVLRIGARAGQFVTPTTELYMMVDLSEVWVYADVYDYELPWVSVGDAVEMTLASAPGRIFRGSLDYIYPYAESKTPTTKVRLVFDNADRVLRPEMFADVTIFADTRQDAVVIPAEAIVRSGTQAQAFVVLSSGKFEPRIVNVGIESNGLVTVLDGVNAGEEVVTSAQFLVDSESKLREATAKMMASAGAEQPPNEAHNHAHHNHGHRNHEQPPREEKMTHEGHSGAHQHD